MGERGRLRCEFFWEKKRKKKKIKRARQIEGHKNAAQA
jgi:hypothetical protein